MAIDPSLRDAQIERLDLLIQIAAKRVVRSRAKLELATLENREAMEGLAAAGNDKEDWLKANPPAQPNLI